MVGVSASVSYHYTIKPFIAKSKQTKGLKESYLLEQNMRIVGVITFIRLQNDA